jgi:pimeloyl-ACP methyl ester carboxylesterase
VRVSGAFADRPKGTVPTDGVSLAANIDAVKEPRIQYARTSDGVSIAYWALGEGPPLVLMPFLIASNTQLEWRNPEARQLFDRMAERRQVIRYDSRGTGLSDRNVSDYSVNALMLDLEAVVDRLSLKTFALFGPTRASQIAIMYAARHPERLTYLLLWNALARSGDLTQTPQMRAIMRQLAQLDWEVFTETYAHVVLGWSEGGRAHEAAGFMRESVTPEALRAFEDAFRDVDVAEILVQITTPTLVLQTRNDQIGSVDGARYLASRIPDARLTVLDGAAVSPYQADVSRRSSMTSWAKPKRLRPERPRFPQAPPSFSSPTSPILPL